MQTLSLQLSDSLYENLENLAKREGVFLNQVLVTAASDEVVRQETREFFANASAPFDADAFAAALAAVPAVAPLVGDEI